MTVENATKEHLIERWKRIAFEFNEPKVSKAQKALLAREGGAIRRELEMCGMSYGQVMDLIK